MGKIEGRKDLSDGRKNKALGVNLAERLQLANQYACETGPLENTLSVSVLFHQSTDIIVLFILYYHGF